MALIVFSWPGVYFRRWHFCLPETGWSLVVKHRAAVDGLWMWIYCQLTRLSGVCEVLASSSRVTRDEFRTRVIIVMHLVIFHLEYWASAPAWERRLGLCRESGRFSQRWLRRGTHSSPGWTSYHLRNTHTHTHTHTHSIQSSWYWIKATE